MRFRHGSDGRRERLLRLLQHRRHRTAQSITGFVVGLGVVVVVVALIDRRHVGVAPKVARINRFHVAFELGVFSFVAIDRQLSFSACGQKNSAALEGLW